MIDNSPVMPIPPSQLPPAQRRQITTGDKPPGPIPLNQLPVFNQPVRLTSKQKKFLRRQKKDPERAMNSSGAAGEKRGEKHLIGAVETIEDVESAAGNICQGTQGPAQSFSVPFDASDLSKTSWDDLNSQISAILKKTGPPKPGGKVAASGPTDVNRQQYSFTLPAPPEPPKTMGQFDGQSLYENPLSSAPYNPEAQRYCFANTGQARVDSLGYPYNGPSGAPNAPPDYIYNNSTTTYRPQYSGFFGTHPPFGRNPP